jgi:hypothetical protein
MQIPAEGQLFRLSVLLGEDAEPAPSANGSERPYSAKNSSFYF